MIRRAGWQTPRSQSGAPEIVLLRGHVLVENGELAAAPGSGRFVRRARFGEQLAAERAAVSS